MKVRKANSSPLKPVIEIDYARYEQLLDDPDLTPEQRRAFLDAVWNIMVEFVSLGFGVHPLQLAHAECSDPACGQVDTDDDHQPILSRDTVEWFSQPLKENFKSASIDQNMVLQAKEGGTR